MPLAGYATRHFVHVLAGLGEGRDRIMPDINVYSAGSGPQIAVLVAMTGD